MRQIRRQTGFRALAVLAAAAVFLATSSGLRAASATALVSATVLGSAETDIGAGAVMVSIVYQSNSERVLAPSAGRTVTLQGGRALSTFRIGGGYNASYSVALPENVTVKSGGSELRVSRFGTDGGKGRLASDGTATFGVNASVTIPAGQAPGVYSGSYPVTIAFD